MLARLGEGWEIRNVLFQYRLSLFCFAKLTKEAGNLFESLQRFCLMQKLQPTLRNLAKLVCGGWEIRTPDQVAPMLPFQGSALDRYANPPVRTIVPLLWSVEQSNGILFV